MGDYIAGASGGVAGIFIGHPFDTVKVMLQTHTAGDHRVKSTREAFRNVWAQGFRNGLFRGMSFPLYSYGAVNSLFFGSYHQSLYHIHSHSGSGGNQPVTNTQRFIAGTLAGVAQLIIACPVEVVKCTMQSQVPTKSNNPTPQKYYKGSISCFRDIARTQGIRGLYKGMIPLFWRDGITSGPYIIIFEVGTDVLMEYGFGETLSEAIAGGVSGCVIWVMGMPFDVIKTRLQTDHGGR